ncbi:uncharacterized protein LOC101848918 [Aplysia californica]|uniref:Uncharacterized protein LOC101848918 n=1 Tax=Aplysia californica TaxID=6500 RepID=A0ABM1A993_APLCA|nr:uncharacterized protein LOC101848918 [Aplysia californica]
MANTRADGSFEEQCIGSADVELVERIFHRIMTEGPEYVKVAGGRTLPRVRDTGARSVSGHSSHNYNNSVIPFPTSSASGKRLGNRDSKLSLTTSGPRNNSENRLPFRNRSAGPLAKRQMASDCGLKSLPVHAKWIPAGREPSRLSQNQVYLDTPDGSVTARKGLSGSKVRSGSITPTTRVPGSTPRASSVFEWTDQASITGASPRPQSFRQSNRNSVTLADEGESEEGVVSLYRWNASDQGLRLQRQLTHLTSSRAMKRASEIMHHRLDPMYLMSGSKVSLQHKYDIDESEMRRLQEMSQVREDLLSDLKKMKFPYGARASTHIVKTLKQNNMDPRVSKTSISQRNQEMPSLKPDKVHYPTPASEPALNSSRVPERPLSEHSDTEPSLNGVE